VNSAALTVRNLTVQAAKPQNSGPAVRSVSFELQAGEVLALVGESGCGKTKTAEAIMGILSPLHWKISADELRLEDTEINSMTPRAIRRLRGSRISMVFQEPLTALDPVFTCGGQLAAVYRRHRDMSRRQARKASMEMFSRVGFAEPVQVFNSYPHQLSGGMRQRVMIAMAMACRPAVLIADEPTTALDVTTQAQVLSQLVELGSESGTAILLITHDLGVVAQYASRALVMAEGQIAEQGTVRELFDNPQHAATRALLSHAFRAAS
jgi:ABC-type dipeptide/oligopeptide/nickel transport system ATPase component